MIYLARRSKTENYRCESPGSVNKEISGRKTYAPRDELATGKQAGDGEGATQLPIQDRVRSYPSSKERGNHKNTIFGHEVVRKYTF